MNKFVNFQLQKNAIFYEVESDIMRKLHNKLLSDQRKENQSPPNKEPTWEANHIILFLKIQ